ncbi:ComF family protein [Paenibacillus lignilyticus]|uniref:ComF family protein n=1 Tax=Paenibacillus lignilyticus TaxID=1172615 RepID=A0ABS5CLM0_9BACL|nr:ComF family protein [Paenibacillus lignilyticus]MBP3966763.1 ComF family protein [Paenibacillus lignilyticus]
MLSDRSPRHAEFPELCRHCFGQIPWITRIYCAVCGRPEGCPDCTRRQEAGFICNRSAVHYDPVIRQWLALYKYRGHEGLAPILGKMLIPAYRGMIAQQSAGSQTAFRFDAVIPVPVSDERLQERGFNQAERLASYLAEHEHLTVYDILQRTRHSDKQSFKTRLARLRDTKQLFAADLDATAEMLDTLNLNSLHQPLIKLLVIDDIYTTGSTANSCALALTEGIGQLAPQINAQIFILTLARS